MDHLCCFCLVFVMPLCASFYLCLMVTCWERADLLALGCGHLTVSLSLSHWYPGSGVVLDCIDSDLCTLTYIVFAKCILSDIFWLSGQAVLSRYILNII